MASAAASMYFHRKNVALVLDIPFWKSESGWEKFLFALVDSIFVNWYEEIGRPLSTVLVDL